MSRTNDIDLTFSRMPELREVMDCLAGHGAEFYTTNQFTYMENSDDLYEWRTVEANASDDLLDRLAGLLREDIEVGFHVHWGGHNRAGVILILPKYMTLSFSPDIHGFATGKIPRLGWFWDVLVESLEPLGIMSAKAQSVD